MDLQFKSVEWFLKDMSIGIKLTKRVIVFSKQLNNLPSHKLPVYCISQIQSNPFPFSLQLPPLRQGFG